MGPRCGRPEPPSHPSQSGTRCPPRLSSSEFNHAKTSAAPPPHPAAVRCRWGSRTAVPPKSGAQRGQTRAGSALVCACLPAHWPGIPQQGFQNPTLPREDVAGSTPAWARFMKRRLPSCGMAGLTHPCPLAALWKAGRTTFFQRDFCPCSSVPGGPSEGVLLPDSATGSRSCRLEGVLDPSAPCRNLQAQPSSPPR